ncbi:MAG: hypothetical protein VXZ40_04360 [Nanoarchaeota archaeon]|nr:hypothetical protein [Nanoarchaeota archaeon]
MNPTLQYLDDFLERYFLGDALPKDEKTLDLLSELEKIKGFAEYDANDTSRIHVQVNGKEYNFRPSAFFKYFAKQCQPTCLDAFMPSMKPVFQVYEKVRSDLVAYSN